MGQEQWKERHRFKRWGTEPLKQKAVSIKAKEQNTINKKLPPIDASQQDPKQSKPDKISKQLKLNDTNPKQLKLNDTNPKQLKLNDTNPKQPKSKDINPEQHDSNKKSTLT